MLSGPAVIGVIYRARDPGVASDPYMVLAHSVHEIEDCRRLGADGRKDVPDPDDAARSGNGLRLIRA